MVCRRDGDEPEKGWVVGEFDDSLIVLPEQEAQGLAALHDALQATTTWADLLTSIENHPDLLREVRERYDEELPEESETFNPDEIRGFTEGDWPEHPKERMIGSIPASIASLGVVGPTLFGEGLLQIAPDSRHEVMHRLRQLGVSYREDDGLISRACGAWRYG
ncbi:MAG TPA: hypothetical protein VKV02_07845 [Acidobacteriaceae bacterium]|nr:hypothetical protein [Acidobacteriaceae bacterium]